MRYVAAYLLASIGVEGAPSKDKIVSILDSVGIDVDDDKLSKLMSELDGKDINEVIAKGMDKLASMPSGGAVATGSAPAAGDAPAEEKKEEKKEESENESDDDMGFGLFD